MNDPKGGCKCNLCALEGLRIKVAMELDPEAFLPMTSTWRFSATASELTARRRTACDKAEAIINQVGKVVEEEYAAAIAGKVASA